jgi:hypothetical protein
MAAPWAKDDFDELDQHFGGINRQVSDSGCVIMSICIVICKIDESLASDCVFMAICIVMLKMGCCVFS